MLDKRRGNINKVMEVAKIDLVNLNKLLKNFPKIVSNEDNVMNLHIFTQTPFCSSWEWCWF